MNSQAYIQHDVIIQILFAEIAMLAPLIVSNQTTHSVFKCLKCSIKIA